MTEEGAQFSLPLEFYAAYLKTINNVKFRRREIDIIAFMLNGRSGKKTASFLSLSPKTIENYTHNIMVKLECNSREGIIDFIEKSDQLGNVRKYYSLLLMQEYFESRIKEIDLVLSKGKRISVTVYYQKTEKHEFLLHEIQRHLKILGASVCIEALEKEQPFSEVMSKKQDTDYVIYAVPAISELTTITPALNRHAGSETSPQTSRPTTNVFFLFLGDPVSGELPLEAINAGCLCLFQHKSYYLFFFELLKRLLPDLDLETIIAEFNKKSSVLFDNPGARSHAVAPGSEKGPPLINQVVLNSINFLKQRKRAVSSFILVCLALFAGVLVKDGLFSEEKRNSSRMHRLKEEPTLSIQSDLLIPADPVLLERPSLITRIHGKFQEKPDSIQTIALYGAGGAGKTTVARQYGRQQTGIVWEANAETPGALRESFENLAYALVKTDAEKNTLMGLKDIKDMDEKEARLLFFVKEKLKSHPGWLLIFDNIEGINNIRNYFPSNPAAWGKGKVIVTTRNSNIAAHSFIHHALSVGELTPEEKLSLFTRITGNGDGHSLEKDQKNKVISLLNNIPSFPLDVSVAAHYLKTFNIPYDEYIKNISENISEFDQVQHNVLNEIGAYSKTRYKIITLSLKEIIKESKDFGDILLFMSLLDSQNIPAELIDKFKDPIIRDSFIHCLKKYSLVLSGQSSSIPCLSMHRSTQDIALAYLSRELKFGKTSPLSQKIFDVIDNYVDQAIEEEDGSRMKLSVTHVERLLDHKGLLPDIAMGSIRSKLGCIYYFVNDHVKSQKAMDESLLILNKNANDNSLKDKVADSFMHIGYILTETGDYPQAQKLFERSLDIYKAGSPRNELGVAWALSYLGNIYRRQGHFEKGKDLLEESIRIQEKHPENPIRMARTLSYMGSVYRWLGDYQKADGAFKTSLKYYQQSLPPHHFRIGWMFSYLGNLHRKLGQLESAQSFFEKGLEIYRANFPKDHVNIGLMCAYLGNNHRKLKNYEQGRLLLEEGLEIYQKQPKKNNERIAWIAFHLGKTYEGLKNQKRAKELFDKSLEFYKQEYQKKGDIEKSEILRRIGEIYLFNDQLEDAESVLTQALNIVEEKNHPNVCESLTTLAQLYEKQSLYALSQGNKKESQDLKSKSLSCLQKALKIISGGLPESSSRVEKIQNKIRELEKT